MRASPYRLIPDGELHRLETQLASIVSDWARRWLDVDGAFKQITATRAGDWNDLKGELWEWEWSGDNSCVMRLPAGARKKWVATMLRSYLTFDVESDVMAELWYESAGQLINEVLSAINGKQSRVAAIPARLAGVASEWRHPGSGVVKLQLEGVLGTMDLLLPLSSPAVAGTPASTAHADDRKRNLLLQTALANQSLSAEMILGSEELSLGELLSLQIGDVIALSQRCDEPVTLRLKDSHVKLGGYLGKVRDSKAFVAVANNPMRDTSEK